LKNLIRAGSPHCRGGRLHRLRGGINPEKEESREKTIYTKRKKRGEHSIVRRKQTSKKGICTEVRKKKKEAYRSCRLLPRRKKGDANGAEAEGGKKKRELLSLGQSEKKRGKKALCRRRKGPRLRGKAVYRREARDGAKRKGKEKAEKERPTEEGTNLRKRKKKNKNDRFKHEGKSSFDHVDGKKKEKYRVEDATSWKWEKKNASHILCARRGGGKQEKSEPCPREDPATLQKREETLKKSSKRKRGTFLSLYTRDGPRTGEKLSLADRKRGNEKKVARLPGRKKKGKRPRREAPHHKEKSSSPSRRKKKEG